MGKEGQSFEIDGEAVVEGVKNTGWRGNRW